MIVITAKFRVKAPYVETWPDIVAAFTTSTRAEPGCLWFEWSRSLDHADEYVLVEAFRDDGAAAHVQSDHFKAAQVELPPYLVATPLIVNASTPGDGWSELGELAVPD